MRHGLGTEDENDFSVSNQADLLEMASDVSGTLTALLGGIGAVSLVVGGIGIMNIMLVSVTERTREIGIRKAIGATNRQIRTQFLVEAAVLSIWGVMIGIILSGAVNLILRIFTDLEPVLMWQPMVIASLVAIAVGILFGVIPAIKASRKDPIDSLRPN